MCGIIGEFRFDNPVNLPLDLKDLDKVSPAIYQLHNPKGNRKENRWSAIHSINNVASCQ